MPIEKLSKHVQQTVHRHMLAEISASRYTNRQYRPFREVLALPQTQSTRLLGS